VFKRQEKPILEPLPGGGQMDRACVASIKRINAKIGFTVLNVGTYRSYAEQAAGYAKAPLP
jgi:hypothetical protein